MYRLNNVTSHEEPRNRLGISLEVSGPTDYTVSPSAYQWLVECAPRADGVQIYRNCFRTRDGELVAYRIWQTKVDPIAAVIMLHGACDYSAAFDELGPELAAKGILALAYDQRGFGTRRSRGQTIEHPLQVDDVYDARAALQEAASSLYRNGQSCERPFLLGESMGGAIAICAAADSVEFSGLILVSPASLVCSYRRIIFRWATKLIALLAPWSAWRVERYNDKFLTDTAAMRFLADPLILRCLPTKIVAELFALASDSSRRSTRVHIPVLTLLGTDDRVLHQDSVKRLHSLFRGESTFVTVPNATHFLLHERRNRGLFKLIAERIVATASKKHECA